MFSPARNSSLSSIVVPIANQILSILVVQSAQDRTADNAVMDLEGGLIAPSHLLGVECCRKSEAVDYTTIAKQCCKRDLKLRIVQISSAKSNTTERDWNSNQLHTPSAHGYKLTHALQQLAPSFDVDRHGFEMQWSITFPVSASRHLRGPRHFSKFAKHDHCSKKRHHHSTNGDLAPA